MKFDELDRKMRAKEIHQTVYLDLPVTEKYGQFISDLLQSSLTEQCFFSA